MNHVFDKLCRLLEASNARFRVIDHAAEGNSERVASVRGTEVGQGAKAMLCRIKEIPESLVLAVVPGDQKIDFRKLAQTVGGRKASLASPNEAIERTGCVIGAIPPFAFTPDIRLVVDRQLLANNLEIAFNAGRLETSIVLNSLDYQRIAEPFLADIVASN